MSRFFSLPVWLRSTSDADYVEAIRQRVRRGSRAAVFGAVSAVLCILAAIRVGQSVLSVFQEEHRFPTAEIAPGMALGLLAGAVSGCLISLAVVQLSLALRFVCGFRTEKLLLKYYDLAAGVKCEK